MATAVECHAMTSYFLKVYKKKYGVTPNVNRNTSKAGFAGMLMDMNSIEIKSLIDYYMLTPPVKNNNHSLNWFLYNYDKIKEALVSTADDKDKISGMLERSEQKAKEWRDRAESRTISN